MSSSDSEEFESADEDFDDLSSNESYERNGKQTEPIKTKIQNSTDEGSNIHQAISNVSSDLTTVRISSNVENVIIDDDNNKNENEKNPILLKKKMKIDKTNEQVHNNSEIQKEKLMKENQHEKKTESKIECEIIRSEKKCRKKHENQVEEKAWDNDDWGDINDSGNDCQQTQSEKINNSKKEPLLDKKLRQQESDEDGWEFDSWGDESENVSDNRSRGTEFFPVLSEISISKEISSIDKESNCKSTSNVSNYDNFPILKSIDSKKLFEKQFDETGRDFGHLVDKMSKNDINPPSSLSSNWGWKPWGGVVSLLTSASDGVATLTSHVSSVIESGIGVPDPGEMARMQHEEKRKQQELLPAKGEQIQLESKEDRSEILGNLMQGVTTIGNRVIFTGLDTLEEIGKKTMNIIQENDPGLLKKRNLLSSDSNGPVLSKMLREAKEKSEESERNLKLAKKHEYQKQLHFESLFDEYHGLVHLEALEMLSKQSALKLESLLAPLSGIALEDLQDTINEVSELCELPDQDSAEDIDGTHTVDELEEKLKIAVEDLEVKINFDEILQCWRENLEWLENNINPNAKQLHDKALRCLAHTSALTVHKMHKLGELILIQDRHSTANEADALVQLTTAICWHLGGIGNRFGSTLSQIGNSEEVNSFITSIFLEGSNSISYIQNAFQLFIPILQIGAA